MSCVLATSCAAAWPWFGMRAASAAASAVVPPYAYVSNAAEGSVSILDLAADRVVGTVKAAQMGAHGVAYQPGRAIRLCGA